MAVPGLGWIVGLGVCSVFFSRSPCATRKHGQHMPELSLAEMSRKQNQGIWNMKGMSTYTGNNLLQIYSTWEIKAKPALRFRGTCLKHVAGPKMSLLETGEDIMFLLTCVTCMRVSAGQTLPYLPHMLSHVSRLLSNIPCWSRHSEKKRLPWQQENCRHFPVY